MATSSWSSTKPSTSSRRWVRYFENYEVLSSIGSDVKKLSWLLDCNSVSRFSANCKWRCWNVVSRLARMLTGPSCPKRWELLSWEQKCFLNVFLGSNTFNICRLCWSQQRLTFVLFSGPQYRGLKLPELTGLVHLSRLYERAGIRDTRLCPSQKAPPIELYSEKTRVVRVPFESWIWFQRPIQWS